MTQVHNLYFQKNLRQALALDKDPRKQNINRSDIMKIRRCARDGMTREETIAKLSLGMNINTFVRRCKELKISFNKNPHKF